jgi:hypothetical protein
VWFHWCGVELSERIVVDLSPMGGARREGSVRCNEECSGEGGGGGGCKEGTLVGE